MSHTATVVVSFNNVEALKAACARVGATLTEGRHTVKLFSESIQADMSIKLPGWQYAIAVCGDKLKYDNYQNHWGDIAVLTKLQDQYSREIVIRQAQMAGMMTQESVEEDGTIVLTLLDYSG